MRALGKPVWPQKTKLTSPEIRNLPASKPWCDSGQSLLFSLTEGDKRRLWSQGAMGYVMYVECMAVYKNIGFTGLYVMSIIACLLLETAQNRLASFNFWVVLPGRIMGRLPWEKKPTFWDATTGFPRNDVWKTSAEIPYWWPVTSQIWVVTPHQYGFSALVIVRDCPSFKLYIFHKNGPNSPKLSSSDLLIRCFVNFRFHHSRKRSAFRLYLSIL